MTQKQMELIQDEAEDNVTHIAYFPSQLKGIGHEVLVLNGKILMAYQDGKSIEVPKQSKSA